MGSHQVADNSIDVDYWYTCRGEYGGDNAVIPIEWLDEGFDFKAAYEEELRKAELARIREQDLELKKKYEGGSK